MIIQSPQNSQRIRGKYKTISGEYCLPFAVSSAWKLETVQSDCLYCSRVQVKIWFQNHRYKTKKASSGAVESSSKCSTSSLSPRCVAVSVLVRDGRPCVSQSQATSHLSSDVIVTSQSPPTRGHVTDTPTYIALSDRRHQRW